MVILGLDAFHEDLLEHTPFLQELYENNPSGPLTSTTPPVTAPAWASFQTGKNQGKHGVYDFVRYDEDYEMEFLDGKSLRAESFYERLDRAGKDCFLFNLPFSLPARIEGDIVPSWLDSNNADPVPADLYEQFDIQPPQYPDLDGDRLENIAEMRDCFEHNKTQFLSVLEANDHDFLFQLVSITDWVQHNGFRELQQEPSSQVAKQTVDMLSTVDEYVKQVYESIEPEDELLILSDHGFKVFDGHLFINDWLQDQGLLKTGGQSLNDKMSEERQTVDIGVLGRLIARQEWLYPILRVIKNAIRSKAGIEFSYEQGVDFDQSTAYCLSDDESAIRLDPNLSSSKREQLVEELLTVLNETDGVSATASQDLYNGPFADEAGDILVHSERIKVSRGPVGRVTSNAPIAHHSCEGFLISVSNSKKEEIEIQDASLLDIAPTVLSLYDLDVPNEIDGDVLAEITNSSTTFIDTESYNPQFISTGSEDKSEVEDRLSNLGYL